jgi:hypothetical protein
VLVYAHSYFLALAADRTGDREFPAHEHVSQLFVAQLEARHRLGYPCSSHDGPE